MSFSDNFTAVRKIKGFTNEAIARRMEVGIATVAHWSNGRRTPSPEQIEEIASILQCSVAELFGEDKVLPSTIPLIGIASCGVPSISYDDYIEQIPVSEDIARDGVYALTADGDSMLPRIKHGDIVICDREMECVNGNIVHYTTSDGESGIKLYQCDPTTETVTLYPLNTDGHYPITVHRDSLKCARAFKIQSDL